MIHSRVWAVRLAFVFLALAQAGAGQAEISYRASSTSAGQGGAIAYVGNRESAGQGTSVSVTIPAAALEGDLLLAVVAVENRTAAAITAPPEFTLIRGDDDADHTQLTYYRFATAADVAGAASWVWSWAGANDYSAGMLAIRGVDAAAPVNAHAGAAGGGNSQTVTAPAVTPDVDGTFLVAAMSIRSQSTFAGWSSGLGAVNERTDERSANAADEIAHGTGTRFGPAAGVSSGSITATASVTDTSRIGQMIALTPRAVTLAMPAGTGEGDLMVAIVAVEIQTDATVTMNGGAFTKIRGDNDPDHSQSIYYRFATAADVASAGTNWGWSWGAATRDYSAALLVFRGVDAAAPIDASAGLDGPGGNVTTINVPAATPSVAQTMLVAAASIRSGSQFSGWTGALSEITDARSAAGGDEVGLGTAIQAGPAAGVSSGAFTVTGSDNDTSRIGQTLLLRPAAVPGPVLRWRMDEAGWNGTAGEIRDWSGNNLHGTGFLSATTTATNPKFCRSGSFNGTDQYAQAADNALLDLTDRLTVAAWVRPAAYGAELKTIVSKDTNYEFHLTNAGNVNWYWSGGADAITTAGAAPLNSWTHIAIVYTRGAQEVYINGLLDTHNWANPDRGALAPNASPFQVGQDQGVGTRWFDGLIDEVRVYNHAMSAADVQTLYNDTPVPACPLDHFAVTPTGGATASTCFPKGFTVTAQDVNNNTYAGYAGTVNLATSTGRGTWTNGDGAGSLSGGPANSGTASYGFDAGDAGDVALNLANQSQDDLAVSAADAAQPWVTGSSATVNYRDNAFLISEDLSSRIGGNAVAVAGRPHDLRATYIYKDSVTANCGTLASYTGEKSLKAWISRAGADPGGAAPQVGATALPNAAPGANNLNLTFAAGVADFNLATSDVGKYALNLRDDAPGVANTAVSGASAILTVRPFTLAVSGIRQGATDNAGNSGSGGAVFAAAGSPFEMTIGAYRHNAAGDANDDGMPDAGATFAQVSGGGLAPAFSASAAFSAVAPFTPAAGGILNNAGAIAMAAGSANPANLNFTEVGSFTLSTADVVTNYLGTGGLNLAASVFDASGAQVTAAPVIGRFRPDHFFLAPGPALTNRAAASCTPASAFSYMDEGLTLAFTLQARNALGDVTVNYDGAYARLPLTHAGLNLGARSGATGLTGRLDTGVPPSGSWSSGSAAVSVTTAVTRATPDSPDGPYAALQFGIGPVDADAVAMQALDFDADVNGADERKNLGVSTEVRYGRLRLQNAVAADRMPLRLPLSVQYWNGTAFVVNAQDSCTSIPRSAIALDFLPASGVSACETAVSTPVVGVTAGLGTLTLTAPGAGNAGSVLVTPNLDAAAGSYCDPSNYVAAGNAQLGYLTGRWNDSVDADADPQTVYDDNPAARGAFGVYGSRPRKFIFFRENY